METGQSKGIVIAAVGDVALLHRPSDGLFVAAGMTPIFTAIGLIFADLGAIPVGFQLDAQ